MQAVRIRLARRFSITESGMEQTCIWAMLKHLEGGVLLFLQSQDRKNAHTVEVNVVRFSNSRYFMGTFKRSEIRFARFCIKYI